MSYESFYDELEKIGASLMLPAIVAATGWDSINAPTHTGKSPTEHSRESRVEAARRGAKKGDKEGQKELHKALEARAKAARRAESAGVSTALVGSIGVGRLGERALSRSLIGDDYRAFERNRYEALTSKSDVDKLRRAIAPNAPVHLAKGGGESAMHIPKGGVMPRFMRKAEEAAYRARGIPEDAIQQGLKSGMNIIPTQTGPHVGAHELGHHAFRRGRVGGFLGKTKLPLRLGAGVGSIVAATRDPDSTTAKYVAPALGAAAVAPVLGEEAAASIKALRGMRAAGYGKDGLRAARKQLAKAWGTYGLRFGLPAVAAPIAIRAMRASNIKRRKARGITSSDILKQRAKEQKKKLKEM